MNCACAEERGRSYLETSSNGYTFQGRRKRAIIPGNVLKWLHVSGAPIPTGAHSRGGAADELHFFQQVTELGLFGAEIFFIVGAWSDFDWHAFDHFQPVPFNADNLARIVGDQTDFVQPELD